MAKSDIKIRNIIYPKGYFLAHLKDLQKRANTENLYTIPHPPRGYGRNDLLPAYFFALESYYELLKKKNSKRIVINLYDRSYKRFITKVINIFYAMSIVKRQEKLNKE